MNEHEEWKARWPQLGLLAAARRRELGLTQSDITKRGGPSVALVRSVEGGTYSASMQATVKRGYEAALLWAPHSIDKMLLEGEEPEPLADDSPAPRLSMVRPDLDTIDSAKISTHRESDGSWKYMAETVGQPVDDQSPSRVEISYWPGAGRRLEWAGELLTIANQAHRAALRATRADERRGGDGHDERNAASNSEADDMSAASDELAPAAKKGVVEESGEFNT